MTRQKATEPDNELVHRGGACGEHAICKNCRSGIIAEYIKEIWTHGSHNPYSCTLAEPLDEETRRLEDNRQRYTTHICKSHNYQKNSYSKAMICSRCGDTIHERDFFTNRNIYWCRVCNSKFSNIGYHKKKFHNEGKTVMDYIEYRSSFEEKPKVFEDRKRRWSTSGWGVNKDIWIGKGNRIDFRIIDYGFISKTKFAKILCMLFPHENISSILNYGVLLAGNDIKFFNKPDEKELILFIKDNRVWIKVNHNAEIVWLTPEFTTSQKKEVRHYIERTND